MPAPLGPCIICSSSSSKYKCPSCQAPTCSLPCHKEHKASNHTASSSASGSSTSTATSSAAAGPSTSALTASATSWVPMRSYDSSQFLKDYHFLSQIGRHVSAAGKELVSQGWMPPTGAPQQQQQHDNGKRPSGPAGGSVDPQKWRARKQREALEEAVRGRRCKVLWLPEGMGRREENRTSCAGGGNNRRGGGGGGGGVRWSLDLAWGCSSGKEKKRQILHDVAGGMPIEVKVMAELQRESLKAAPKGWKREADETTTQTTMQNGEPTQLQEQQQVPTGPAGGGASSSAKKRARRRGAAKARGGGQNSVDGEAGKDGADASNSGPSTSTPAGPSNHAQHPTEYLISDHVLSTYGLLPPSSTSPTSSPPSTIPQPYTSLPPSIALAVQVHPTRLRNESSAKFLEWWERRGKAQQAEEEAEERAAEALAMEAVAQQEQAAKLAAQGAYGGNGRGGSPPTAPRAMLQQQQMGGAQGYANPLAAPQTAAAPTSLLSAGLLAQLSAKLNAANAMQAKQSATAASPPLPAQGNAKTTQEVATPNGQQQRQVNGREPKAASPPAPAAKPRPPVRLLYPLPASGNPQTDNADSSTAAAPQHSSAQLLTLEGMLRSLPRGHSIVEFARVEVWRKEELQRYVARAKRKDEREDGEEESSGVRVVLWEEEGDEAEGAKDGAEGQEKVAAAQAAAVTPSVSLSAPVPAAAAPSPSTAVTATNPPRPPVPAAAVAKPVGLAGLLSGYASDSDDEDEEEDEERAASQSNADEQPVPAVSSSNQTIRLDNTVAESRPLLSQYDDEYDDSGDEDLEEDSAGGGLAAMARRLGWARAPPPPSAAPSTVSSAPEDAAAAAAATVVPKRRKRRKHMPVVEEEQLDWGDE